MEGDFIELDSKLNKYVAAQSLKIHTAGVLVECLNS